MADGRVHPSSCGNCSAESIQVPAGTKTPPSDSFRSAQSIPIHTMICLVLLLRRASPGRQPSPFLLKLQSRLYPAAARSRTPLTAARSSHPPRDKTARRRLFPDLHSRPSQKAPRRWLLARHTLAAPKRSPPAMPAARSRPLPMEHGTGQRAVQGRQCQSPAALPRMSSRPLWRFPAASYPSPDLPSRPSQTAPRQWPCAMPRLAAAAPQ